MEFKDAIADIITGLENGTFKANADEDSWAKGDEDFQEAVDVIAGLLNDGHTKWQLLAVETHIRQQGDHVRVDEVEDYLEDTYLNSGATVASTLEEHASADEVGKLGQAYELLDEIGGLSRFDWGGYAGDGMTPTNHLSFIQVPAPTGEDSWFLFRQR